MQLQCKHCNNHPLRVGSESLHFKYWKWFITSGSSGVGHYYTLHSLCGTYFRGIVNEARHLVPSKAFLSLQVLYFVHFQYFFASAMLHHDVTEEFGNSWDHWTRLCFRSMSSACCMNNHNRDITKHASWFMNGSHVCRETQGL